MSLVVSRVQEPISHPPFAPCQEICGTVKQGRDGFCKISEDFVSHPQIQKISGLILGALCYSLSHHFLAKTSAYFSISPLIPVPSPSLFPPLAFPLKLFLVPCHCMSGAIWEEDLFRGNFTDHAKKIFTSLYGAVGLTGRTGSLLSRISAVVTVALLYGASVFLGSLKALSNPSLFLPQFLLFCFLGTLFGLAGEITGSLYVPASMNIAYKTLHWFS